MKKITMRVQLLTLFFFGVVGSSMAQTSDYLTEKHERHKNMTIREYNTDAKGNSKWMDHLTVYDAKGLKMEEIEYATFGMRERILFEYDAKENCVKEVVFDERNKVSRIRKYIYNADGTKKTQYNYLPNGRLFSTKQFNYAIK